MHKELKILQYNIVALEEKNFWLLVMDGNFQPIVLPVEWLFEPPLWGICPSDIRAGNQIGNTKMIEGVLYELHFMRQSLCAKTWMQRDSFSAENQLTVKD